MDGELLLQGEEVLVRLQVGVGLRQREQLPQRAGEDVLGLGLLLGPGALGLDRGVARLHDAFEGALLVRGVALDRLDQVGDEVVAPLELHADLRPRGVDAVAQLDEPVVARDEPDHEHQDDGDDDDPDDHDWAPALAR